MHHHPSFQVPVRFLSSTPSASTFAENSDDIGTTIFTSTAVMDGLCQKHLEIAEQEFALGCRFLHQTALGNLSELQAMLQQQQPSLVNFRDYDRRTPLHIAASEGHLEICQWLVDHGARINRSDRWGGSPLDDCKRHRHSHVFTYLRQRGAVFGSPSQANNLITAAYEGDVEEIKVLLEYGNVNVNQADYDKRTALHLAAGEGHVDVVKLLCQIPTIDVNVQDRWGNRPLDDAKNSNHTKCIATLEQYGAKAGTSANATLGEEALHDLMHQYGKIRDGVLSMDWHDVKDMLQGIGEDRQTKSFRNCLKWLMSIMMG